MYDDRTSPVRRHPAHGGTVGAVPVAVAPRQRDPFWTRLGVLLGAGLLVAPGVAALRGESSVVRGQPTGGAVAIVQPARPAPTVPATAVSTTPVVAVEPTSPAPAPLPAATPPPVVEPARVESPDEAQAERVETCSRTYEVRAGDSWFGIAKRAEVSASVLAAHNGFDLESALYPGDELCVPEGARYPVPPPTSPITTAPAPRPVAGSSTAAPTSVPRTTAAPATAVADESGSSTTRPPTSYSADEVKDIIRSVFPDDLEERAIEIAWRESNWKPWVYNGHCCYGLFQIYWSVHRSWLGDLGIDSSSDLLDPWLNARAAYVLYQRSGNSWAPWGG